MRDVFSGKVKRILHGTLPLLPRCLAVVQRRVAVARVAMGKVGMRGIVALGIGLHRMAMGRCFGKRRRPGQDKVEADKRREQDADGTQSEP